MMAYVESWRVGDFKALYSTTSGALALVNETASTIWEWLSDDLNIAAAGQQAHHAWGLGESEARALVENLFESWKTAGLLRIGGGENSVDRIASLGASVAQPYHFETDFGRFRLVCEDDYAQEVMTSVLSPLQVVPGNANDRREVLLELRGTRNAYWATRDGVVLNAAGNISLARHHILQQLITDNASPGRTAAVLHASAVSIAGHAILLAGDSGSGKSTLTACLVRYGAGYIADDLVPLESNGRWTSTFPVGLAVKSGSWKMVEPLFAATAWSGEQVINAFRVKYADLREFCPFERRIAAGAIIFPRYSPGADFNAEPISPERALQILISTGSRVVKARPTMEGLCRLADRTPAWQLTYCDWRDAATFIYERLGAPTPDWGHR